MWWLIGGAGIFLAITAIACVGIALNYDRRVIAMRGTGTLSASEIERLHRAGERGLRCEITGVIECDSPMTAPMSNMICVAYSHQVVQHMESGVYSDLEDTRNSRATLGSWSRNREYTQVESPNERRARFYVRDASGRLLVDPAWATIDMPRTDERYESITSGVDTARPETVGAWNTEDALALGSPVYVLGYLGEVYGEAALVCHSDQEYPFVISYRSERELERSVSTRSNLLYLGSGIAGALGIVMIWLAAGRLF